MPDSDAQRIADAVIARARDRRRPLMRDDQDLIRMLAEGFVERQKKDGDWPPAKGEEHVIDYLLLVFGNVELRQDPDGGIRIDMLPPDESLFPNGEHHAMPLRPGVPKQAAYCQEVLGQRLTAFACGIKSPKLIGQWARDKAVPTDQAAERLATLFDTLGVLSAREGPETVAALMRGQWSSLGNENPLVWINEGRSRSGVTNAAVTAGEQGAA